MTSAQHALADSAPLPVDVLERVRADRAQADAAELRILKAAVEWAVMNPVLNGQEAWKLWKAPTWLDGDLGDLGLCDEDLEWIEIPQVRWDAPAAFAAANGMTTTAGEGPDPRRAGAEAPDPAVLDDPHRRGLAGHCPGVAGP